MSNTFLILTLIIIAIFVRMKHIDLILRTFNTLIHELSHALFAKLFRQKVQKIIINRNFSGSCVTKISNKKSMFFISLAGYTIPSIIGYVLVYISTTNVTKTIFYIFIIIAVLALIFLIGNSFGRLWTICFCGLNLIFVLVPIFSQFYKNIIFIYAVTLLIENLLSILTLIHITLSTPKTKTDATLLKKSTKIPAFIWTLLFFAFAFWLIVMSIRLLI